MTAPSDLPPSHDDDPEDETLLEGLEVMTTDPDDPAAAALMPVAVALDIVADFACPWCYVGKVLLDRALEARPAHPFLVEWHPYELNPEMPKPGMTRDSFLKARFGDLDAILAAHAPLVALAESHGVALNLPAIERMPNTFDAHRLAHWAGIEGKQAAVVSALYRAMWVEGRDIGDAQVLAQIADRAGMDGDMVMRLIDSDADVETIRAKTAHSRVHGIDSVPAFVVAEQHALFGAQPPELWLDVIDEIGSAAAAAAAEAAAPSGDPE